MIRGVLYILASIFLIAVVRMIIGALGKLFTETFGAGATASGTTPTGGELKKCSVCGTYSPAALGAKSGGKDVFLCSEQCATKYRKA